MSNIKIVHKAPLTGSQQNDIIQTINKRAVNVLNDGVCVEVIIDPVLTEYPNIQSIGGNSSKYLIDEDDLIDSETLVRLATFSIPDFNHSVLFIFHNSIVESVNTENNTIPSYFQYTDDSLKSESEFVISFLSSFKNTPHQLVENVLFISGAPGMGKTTLAHYIAEKINSKVHHLTYSDIDGESTAAIAKNISKFFSHINALDFVVIDDADSFLKGPNINHFVKNAFVSQINKRNDIIFVVETTNPSDYGYDISKHSFRTLAIKNLKNTKRVELLSSFLLNIGIRISEDDLNKTVLTGLSVKDLKRIASFARVIIDTGASSYEALKSACNTVHDSILKSTLSSDSIFKASRPKYELDNVILPNEKKEKILYASKLIKNIPIIYDNWTFSQIDPHPRSIINFYGEPGTGKTMSAHAIANILGKDILALNYAEVESKYIGEAPKKLESAFAFAKQHDCVMFFDEADSFLGKRIEDVSHSADQALNSLRSTMLIQLEQFEGVVIFASNLRENYDKAFHSRFLYEIEFELPSSECRKEMLKSFFSKIRPLQNLVFSSDEYENLSVITEGLSGRHIKSGILETLNKIASTEMPFPATDLFVSMLVETYQDKNSCKLNVTVNNSDISEDKKMIGEALAKEYAPSQAKDSIDNSKYIPLIYLAYYASFSDNVVDEEELKVLKETERSLGISIKEISCKEDLPDIASVISDVTDAGLKNQAIELIARIVAADGQYTEDEKDFVNNVAYSLGMNRQQIPNLHVFIDQLVTENELLKNLFGQN
jgi:AAA+ superfamily predicted ATPase